MRKTPNKNKTPFHRNGVKLKISRRVYPWQKLSKIRKTLGMMICLFTAHVVYEPAKTEQNTTAEIIFGFFRKNKGIPNLCPKCLESLEFPDVMEMHILIDTSDT